MLTPKFSRSKVTKVLWKTVFKIALMSFGKCNWKSKSYFFMAESL